ncbi:MAG TPA: VOC family protein [Acidimicrobiales bacterium]|nr:VOC family protein [Acidimicrobiales bacterium]
MLHHLTLWVPDLERAAAPWQWLMVERLGYEAEQRDDGLMVLFRDGNGFTLVLEESPDMVPGMLHSRLRPGLNHVAFTLDSAAELDAVVEAAPSHGWSSLPVDRHPIAGGAAVAYLEDRDGFEVELVAPVPEVSGHPDR